MNAPIRRYHRLTLNDQRNYWHHQAHIYADIGWPDLKPPEQIKFTPDEVTKHLEKHMANSADMQRLAKIESLRAAYFWRGKSEHGPSDAIAERDRRIKIVIETVTAEPGITAHEMAHRIGCSAASVTKYARHLMERKLIRHERDKDGRYHYFPMES